jgi:hypothetical protein
MLSKTSFIMKRLLLFVTAIISATYIAKAQNADEQAAMKA